MYTSICFLSANLEHLELSIANLDHTLDIIGVSDTWTPETNQNTQNITIYQVISYIAVLKEIP